MATAFNATPVTTSEADLFNAESDGGGPCTTFKVVNQGATDMLVNIPGLHASGDWFPVAGGTGEYFACHSQDIRRVRAKTASGSTTAGGGIVVKADRGRLL